MNSLSRWVGLTLIGAVLACAPANGPATTDATADLHALFDEAWSFVLEENPFYATYVGKHDYDDRLPSVSLEDEARRAEYWQGTLERLAAIDRSSLPVEEQINYDMFETQVSDRVTAFELNDHLIPITAESGSDPEIPFPQAIRSGTTP